MTLIKRSLLVISLVVLALWINNTSLFFSIPEGQKPKLLAHRGVHQIYAGSDRSNDTCTANPIAPLNHKFIANTLPSIEAAFGHGADVVELDIHLTTDGTFAVFHDWTLDCQTDGTGVTHEQSFAYLRTLDLGYGYTADGTTFPLRGTAKGAMPSLADVLEIGFEGQYLINFKSNRAEEGRRLAAFLESHPGRGSVFGVYGGTRPTQSALAADKTLRGFDKPALKACLFAYIATGWSGYVPKACRNTLVAVPIDYAPYLWGWPHRFTGRMQAAGTEVILWGPYDGSGFSSGVDDPETLARVPEGFAGYVWTNRIEIIGPL